MFSSSSFSWAGRTAAPLPLMGCWEEAMVLWCRVQASSLAQRRHATLGAHDCPVRQKVVKVGVPISDNEALLVSSASVVDRGFSVQSRGRVEEVGRADKRDPSKERRARQT